MSRILNNLLVVGTGSGQAMGITGGYTQFNNSLLLGNDAAGYSIYQYGTQSNNYFAGKVFLGLTADDGLTMLQSGIINFGTTSQIAALNIVSSADSTYIQSAGTTSYIWTPSNNGKISWTNRFYNKNELASIAVVGDKASYTSFGTTSSYLYNTGNLVFSIGSSVSVATEKMRIMNDSIAIPVNTSLKIGYSLNSVPSPGLAPLTIAYQSGYSSFGAIYISTNTAAGSPVTNSLITIDGNALNTGTTNGFTIGAVASSTRAKPGAWIGSLQPGRGSVGSNIYVTGGQYGIISRRTGYATNSVSFSTNASIESNTVWEDYAYVAQNYISGANLTTNLIQSFNNYYSTITVGALSFATNSVTTNNISIADFRSSGLNILGMNSNQGQFNTTVTRYGLLIDFLSKSGTVSTILDDNRTGIGTYSLIGWGVYQSDVNTKNYFAGNLLLGTNSSDGSLLRVSGSASISGNLSLTSTISDKTGSTGAAGYILSASGSGVYWVPNTGVANAFIQNGNSFGGAAILGTNDNNLLQFETNNTTVMTLGTNSNVGIGVAPNNYNLNTKSIYVSSTISTNAIVGINGATTSLTFDWDDSFEKNSILISDDTNLMQQSNDSMWKQRKTGNFYQNGSYSSGATLSIGNIYIPGNSTGRVLVIEYEISNAAGTGQHKNRYTKGSMMAFCYNGSSPSNIPIIATNSITFDQIAQYNNLASTYTLISTADTVLPAPSYYLTANQINFYLTSSVTTDVVTSLYYRYSFDYMSI